MGLPKPRGTFFGGPHSQDYGILGSALRVCLGKLLEMSHSLNSLKGG